MCRGTEPVGVVTSGNFSPMRERGIGLGFVDADAQMLDGDEVTIVQRGRDSPPGWCDRRCGRSEKRANESSESARAGQPCPYSGRHN